MEILELKITTFEMKNSLERSDSRLAQTEERIRKPENQTIMDSEEQKQKE